jgi:hypothetical protein
VGAQPFADRIGNIDGVGSEATLHIGRYQAFRELANGKCRGKAGSENGGRNESRPPRLRRQQVTQCHVEFPELTRPPASDHST